MHKKKKKKKEIEERIETERWKAKGKKRINENSPNREDIQT